MAKDSRDYDVLHLEKNIKIMGGSSEGCQRFHTCEIQELKTEYPKSFPLTAAQKIIGNHIITKLHINADSSYFKIKQLLFTWKTRM